MKKFMKKLVFVLLVVVLVSNAGANLLSNPGFETPVLGEGNHTSTAPAPWYSYTNQGNIWHCDYPIGEFDFPDYDGVQILEMAGFQSVDQDVAMPGLVQADTEYTFTLHVYRPTWVGPGSFNMQVGWDGWAGWIETGDIAYSDSAWGEYSLTLDTAVETAAVGASDISVEVLLTSGDLAFDGMVLTPEPTTIGLLGLGGLLLRRRRRQ